MCTHRHTHRLRDWDLDTAGPVCQVWFDFVLFQAREAAKPKVEAKVVEEEIVHEDNEWGKSTFNFFGYFLNICIVI